MSLDTKLIRVALQISLLGEIYPDIRAIAYRYNTKKKFFLLRYYLNRPPVEEDYDNVSEVMTEFISNFKHSDFEEIKEECCFSDKPKGRLDTLDGLVYLKKE